MGKGSILGFDLNDNFCQISYYDENKDEPETLEISQDNYQIPLILGFLSDHWSYGREAKRLENITPENTVSHLYTKAVNHEKVELGGQMRDGVWLLAKFISMVLERFEKVDFITFSVPECNVDVASMLKGIGQRIGVPKDCVVVQDYKESFCNYMFYQPKELWQYETALFYCDEREISAFMLRKLHILEGKTREQFVTVEKVADAHIEELEAIYPFINSEKAKDADYQFKKFVENVFQKKVISSVYLIGEGFEQNWYPESLRVLCNGRRAFLGNNLYSKGACYSSIRSCSNLNNGPVYLDETKMTKRISLKMRVRGKEGWYPIVSWGTHWYEADGQWEVLLAEHSDIEIHIDSLDGEKTVVETVSLDGLPERDSYSLRLSVEVLFLSETSCKIVFKDVGFGAFFPPSDFMVEKILELGDNDGQFNSLSR